MLLNATFADTQTFKSIVESMKTLGCPVSVKFSRDGLIMQGISMNHISCMTAHLSRSAFKQLICPQPFSFCVDVGFLSSVLRFAMPDHTISMVANNINRVAVSMVAPGDDSTMSVNMTTVDLDSDIREFELDHPIEFVANASIFGRGESLTDAIAYADLFRFSTYVPDKPTPGKDGALGIRIDFVPDGSTMIASSFVKMPPKMVAVNILKTQSPEDEVADDGEVNYRMTEINRLSTVASKFPGSVCVRFGGNTLLATRFTVIGGYLDYHVAPCQV